MPRSLDLLDFAPSLDVTPEDVLAGLRDEPRWLPCKLFYDDRGSRLFERICEQPEYYPTRAETSIMRAHSAEMAERLGSGLALVELGSGASEKTRWLLDRIESPAAYIPIDISKDHLLQSAAGIARDYPSLDIRPVCADYEKRFHLPPGIPSDAPHVVYFPGSTIGNFHPDAAARFLERVADITGSSCRLLIGVDRKKDPAVLESAYNDAAGVTAAFNANVLLRLNRELGADFDAEQFAHRAFYNAEDGRVEMHLVSRRTQTVHLNGTVIPFAEGETIWTESSYKYTVDGFARVARQSGFEPEKVWTDESGWFSVHLCRFTRDA